MNLKRTKKEQSIEQMHINQIKVNARYKMALVALLFSVAGVVAGWFLAVNVMNDTQHKAVEALTVVTQSK